MDFDDVELKKEKERDIMGAMPSSLIKISFAVLIIVVCLLIIAGTLLYVRVYI